MTETIVVSKDESVYEALATALGLASSEIRWGALTQRGDDWETYPGWWQQHVNHRETDEYIGTVYYDEEGNSFIELDDDDDS